MTRRKLFVNLGVATLAVMLIVSFACKAPAAEPPAREPEKENYKPSLTVSSTAFEDGGEIPVEYSCWGINYSPQLSWSQGPAGTQSFALVMDDPDALKGVFTHWVLYNIPQDITELHKGISTNGILDTGAIQGRNDLAKLGYYGPCPPEGKAHRYRFTVYALETTLDLPAASKQQLLKAIEGHVLAEGRLTGTYKQ